MKKHELAAAIEAAVESITEGNTRAREKIAEAAGLSESGIRSMYQGVTPSVINLDALLRTIGRRLVLGDPDGEILELEAPRRRAAG